MTMRMGDGPVDNLPSGLDAYAGYVNQSGIGITYPGILVKFPNAHHLPITTNGSPARCADVERGAMSTWKGYEIGYASVSSTGDLIARDGRPKLLWTAHYTDVPHICTSAACWPSSPVPWVADGTQWTTHGGVWDESLLTDAFFPVPHPPQPPIHLPSTPSNGGRMSTTIVTLPILSNGTGWGIFDGGINSDPPTTSLFPAIPWANFTSATAYCDDPSHDSGPATPKIGVQQRNGYLFIKADGAAPGPSTVVAVVVHS